MSGVELIVGAVLGSIPIAIEVYDRSGRVFEVFSAFKKYPREVSILDAKLSVQRTIFRNNAINLLNTVTKDQASVLEVVNRPASAAARRDLTMAPVYRNRIDALGESFRSCAQTAEQIQHSLQVLCSQSDDFRAQIGERQDDISTSEWLKHVKARFRLALGKPKMEEAITELRELNRDFGLITEQIIKHLQQVSDGDSERKFATRRPAKSLNVLQQYYRSRYTSKALYSTLQMQWNCSTHQYHSFDVRIIDADRGKSNGKAKAISSRYVTCELAVTHDDSSSPSKGPLHLEIQQACESDDEELEQRAADTRVYQLTQVLETSADRLKVEVSTGKKSRVQKFIGRFRKEKQSVAVAFDNASTPQLPNLAQSMSDFHLSDHSTQLSTSSSTDLPLIDDVCKTAYNSVACCNDRSFLGSWNGPHAEWFCVPAALSSQYGGSMALSDIIMWISEEPVLRSLPRPILVELAGNVAEGIMQFYSTPWLVSGDLGQNVRYFGPNALNSTSIRLKGPYFMARLKNKKGKGLLQPPQAAVSSGEGITLYRTVRFLEARNELLFNFGILMLEIGFARPWYELKQAVTATLGKLSDYKIAEKLAGQLVNQLGLTYPKIIRKCLGCDFGLGETDMDNEDLQRRFLEDVVAGLQELKDYMTEMNIAPLG
ncbi:uncharacterized protein NECHADRAFT_80816 [Fusarium vanettenii 77-13-4]|uniref:Uncharacterized protein n=1 Tax=Fusarium vanettenii (strain ATCC MYA-4622 / CBS 123669 / FGSC 9596 / NRRL 45880 / 77-13-4) TaxID=660122 RepID=C7YSQ6_FUSV7|nr:uncharacterized protein NECHADRAFT_80816 [Fusarium vanettenii 77-13-4]EEU45284.1 hypothetical protein NECHADRAFT_80816 [Fusarium vanettenii 77-13-4]